MSTVGSTVGVGTAVVVAPETVGQKIKGFFSEVGRELGIIGTDALKAIGIIQKDVSAYEPIILATLAEIFPNVTIPTATVTKIVNASLSTAEVVATALQAEGLNPTLDQTAAISVAAAVHSLTLKPNTAATVAVLK